jgi:DNA (cytosine-5)-methyltransferase 1
MIHMSLFSGIGGFELAAEWMGWRNLVSCEINDFGRKVLDYYWPNGYHHDDIHTLTYDKINEELTQRYGADWRSDDIIFTGGFPCQDASNANYGSTRHTGIKGERTGLINEMLRLISEIKPTYIVAENVANILNINRGKDFGFILGELATLGYNAEWRVSRASEVGSPHQRARLFMVAYPCDIRLQEGKSFFSILHQEISQKRRLSTRTAAPIGILWDDEPEPSWVDDGLFSRLLGITVSKHRKESIKAYGNAIVPQVAHQIFKAIQQYKDQQP